MAEEQVKRSDQPAREEGINTLAAQFTRRRVARYMAIIRHERAKGLSDETIADQMTRALGDYDQHSRKLLLHLASGGAVPDDFPPETIIREEQPKDNTVVMTLAAAPPDIQQYSLVHHHGQEWLVVECDRNKWMLKLLEEGREGD